MTYAIGSLSTPAPAAETLAPEADGSTRERVLQLVVEEGPISAAQLGKKLSLTPAAVRLTLDAMTEQGIVEIKTVTGSKRAAGRPSRRYVLSSRGQQILGDDYLNLVRAALQVLDQHASGEPLAEAGADPQLTPVDQAGIDTRQEAAADSYGARTSPRNTSPASRPATGSSSAASRTSTNAPRSSPSSSTTTDSPASPGLWAATTPSGHAVHPTLPRSLPRPGNSRRPSGVLRGRDRHDLPTAGGRCPAALNPGRGSTCMHNTRPGRTREARC
ncbi:hypothetical protein [Nesterenkonia pannonica]|uniref:helix-turn-helix transcriptional regulator n=1 Tax=Nesterenkonia pannonica TaxID=1548602 RepID=UPI0021648E0F|nr:hypothetical protein [Nesterenkonia pannonica]